MSDPTNEDRSKMSRMADINLIISAIIHHGKPVSTNEARNVREKRDRSIYI